MKILLLTICMFQILFGMEHNGHNELTVKKLEVIKSKHWDKNYPKTTGIEYSGKYKAYYVVNSETCIDLIGEPMSTFNYLTDERIIQKWRYDPETGSLEILNISNETLIFTTSMARCQEIKNNILKQLNGNGENGDE